MKWTRPTIYALLLLIGIHASLVGCASENVRLTFRPKAGTISTYRITVETETTVTMDNQTPRYDKTRAVLTTHHTVLPDSNKPGAPEVESGGVRVQVVVREKGQSDRTFVVRFDRSAQLVAVESEAASTTDGQTSTALGLPEIFPAALSAPPDRSLRSGERWNINRSINLPGSDKPTRLEGYGQLTELGVVDNESVARVAASASLRVATTRLGTSGITPVGELRLDGTQQTNYRATHDLDDGAVRMATSRTTGSYQLQAFPPGAIGGPPSSGTMKVTIRSQAEKER